MDNIAKVHDTLSAAVQKLDTTQMPVSCNREAHIHHDSIEFWGGSKLDLTYLAANTNEGTSVSRMEVDFSALSNLEDVS